MKRKLILFLSFLVTACSTNAETIVSLPTLNTLNHYNVGIKEEPEETVYASFTRKNELLYTETTKKVTLDLPKAGATYNSQKYFYNSPRGYDPILFTKLFVDDEFTVYFDSYLNDSFVEIDEPQLGLSFSDGQTDYYFGTSKFINFKKDNTWYQTSKEIDVTKVYINFMSSLICFSRLSSLYLEDDLIFESKETALTFGEIKEKINLTDLGLDVNNTFNYKYIAHINNFDYETTCLKVSSPTFGTKFYVTSSGNLIFPNPGFGITDANLFVFQFGGSAVFESIEKLNFDELIKAFQ